MSYASQRAWSDQYIPAIRKIVGPLLLEPAPIDVDQKEATDLIVLNARDKRIAARMRKPGYSERYPDEFTIRSSVPSGVETELNKIVNGFGDWMFYGHASGGPDIARWILVDLDAFRAHLIRNRGLVVSEKRKNFDGTEFIAFNWRSFPPSPRLLVARSHADLECAS